MAAGRKKSKQSALLPKPVKIPGLPAPPTVSSLRGDLPSISRGPRGGTVKPTPQQWTEVPRWLAAIYPLMTLPEARIYEAFLKRGLKDGQHFVYQDWRLGGRGTSGGTVVDFAYVDTFPVLLLPVNGNYFHYQRGFKIQEHDLMILRRLRQEGFAVIVLDEDDIERLTGSYVLHLAIDLSTDISEYAGKI